MSEEILEEVGVSPEPIKFDPNKKYTWESSTPFTISGGEFGLILNALRATISTEAAQTILLANKATEAVEKLLARSVEAGIVKEQI